MRVQKGRIDFGLHSDSDTLVPSTLKRFGLCKHQVEPRYLVACRVPVPSGESISS